MKRKSSAITTPAKRSYAVKKPKYQSLKLYRNVKSNSVGFPKQMIIKHRYVEGLTLTSTSAVSVYKYSANGLYDPNLTGGGHQPAYFDNLSALYDHYTVTRSWFTLEFFVVPSGTTAKGTVAGVYIDDDTTTAGTTFQAMCEDGTANYHVVPAQSTDKYVVKASWSAKDFFGPNPRANDNLQGSSGANPTEASVYTIFLQDQLAGAVNTQIQGVVTITYEATWDELKSQDTN